MASGVSLNSVPGSNPVYQELIAAIWPNNLYLGTEVDLLVPYDNQGAEFTLSVLQVGVDVSIRISRLSDPKGSAQVVNTINHIARYNVESIRLPLGRGLNLVDVASSLGSLSIIVGVAHYATAIYVQAQRIYSELYNRLEQRKNLILSPTGSFQVERWFPEVWLLPETNAWHRLSMRAAVDGFANAALDIGVRSLASALTGNNPVITSLHTGNILDSASPRYNAGEEKYGYDLDVWLLDSCAIGMAAALKYLRNHSQLWELLHVSGGVLTYRDKQRGEVVTLSGQGFTNGPDSVPASCSVERVLLTAGCMDRARPWMRIQRSSKFVLCAAQYNGTEQVESCYALGSVNFDCDRSLDEAVNDEDLVDSADPTGDGWVGTILAEDTGARYVESFLTDVECHYAGTPISPLSTLSFEVSVEAPVTGTASLVIRQINKFTLRRKPGAIIQPTGRIP